METNDSRASSEAPLWRVGEPSIIPDAGDNPTVQQVLFTPGGGVALVFVYPPTAKPNPYIAHILETLNNNPVVPDSLAPALDVSLTASAPAPVLPVKTPPLGK